MTEERFISLVQDELKSLPDEFRSRLENVEILVEDTPTEEQTRKLKLHPYIRLFGLFEGVPQTVPGEGRSYFPDKITLFRHPMLERFSTEDEIKIQIRKTLLHEIGHYFGMSEEELRLLNY